MRHNPMAGPAHIDALANKLMGRADAYTKPPPSGGDQFSVRFGENLKAHLDAIVRQSGWTRSQVMTAVMNRGLFDLYERVTENVMEAIMEDVAKEVVPMMHSDTNLTKEAKRIAGEIVGEHVSLGGHPLPDTFWVFGLRQPKGIPRMLVRIDAQASDDYERAKGAHRAVIVESLRREIAAMWAKASKNPGTEPKLVFLPEMFAP